VSLLQSAEDKQWLVQFHTAFEACRMPARQFVDALSKSDLHRVETGLLVTAFNKNFKIADKLLAEMLNLKKTDGDVSFQNAQNQIETAILLTICLLVATIVLVAGFGYLMVMSIRRPTEQIRFAVEQLADGKLDVQVPYTDYFNEFGELARSIEVLQSEAKQMAAQRWLKTHQATIQAQLQLANNFTDLARRFLSTLSPLISIGQAAFYIFDERRQHLRMLGGYAYKERKHFTPFFSLGQGLVGQCALEREPIIISEPPEDYLHIGSSLGAAKATTVAVYPVVNKDRLLAVVEFATFAKFSKEEQELLASIMPILAMSLEILERNVRTQQLLEETQRQAEAGLFESSV
ncbi:MAG: GAF domain-containing protein, partial [Trichlorobacter sp.]|nr:GAF domain-containing protein [Trichlorobacter sp.]